MNIEEQTKLRDKVEELESRLAQFLKPYAKVEKEIQMQRREFKTESSYCTMPEK
jgi:hypothetical protein